MIGIPTFSAANNLTLAQGHSAIPLIVWTANQPPVSSRNTLPERNARQARRPIPVSDPNSTTNIHPSGAMVPPRAISKAPTTLKLAVPSEKAAVLRMLGINTSRSG